MHLHNSGGGADEASLEYVLTFEAKAGGPAVAGGGASADASFPARVLYLGVLNTRSALQGARARVPYNISITQTRPSPAADNAMAAKAASHSGMCGDEMHMAGQELAAVSR